MTQWAYRSNESRVSADTTKELADKYHFLCRSAFNNVGAFISNVKHVKFGDIIHLYFLKKGDAQSLGSFEVINDDSKSIVKDTCLHIVTDPNFEQHLKQLDPGQPAGEGYGPDPSLGKFVGWLIKRVDIESPVFPKHLFPQGFPGSLVEIP